MIKHATLINLRRLILTRKHFLLALVFLLLLPARVLAQDACFIDTSDAWPGQVTVPGRGAMRYYAQNDPTWSLMTYRFPHQETEPRFSGAGCVPTALANLIANLVEPEQLPAIDAYSYRDEGFFICPCSMNRFDCDRTHTRYRLTTVQDFDQFFCLAVGSYLSGNNPASDYACGTLYMAAPLLRIYGLRFVLVDENLSLAAQAVAQEGALALMLVGGPDCPYTSGGHALVLCAVDGESYYFLDSFRREEYPLDTKGILRMIEPGVTAVRRDRVGDLGAYQIYVVYPPSSRHAAETP